MKLYYYKGACSLVTRIILNELGIKFQGDEVDLRAKKTADGEDFLAINPKGAVPAISLDNGDVITEGQVILQYLADNTPGQELLAPVGDIKRYHTLEWLNFISTEIHKTFGLFFNQNVPDDVKKDILIPIIMLKFGFIDYNLSNNMYLMGDHFTLPDAYLFVMVRWAHHFKIDLSAYKHLAKFIEFVQSRPAVIKSLNEEGFNDK